MKQKLTAFLLTLATAFSLTGCSDMLYAVSVIGGADGPTKILVNEPGGETSTQQQETAAPTDSESGTQQETATTPAGSESSAQQETATQPPETPTGSDGSAGEILPIDADGTYNSVEDVGLYLYTYGELPDNYLTKNEARSLGWEGGSVETYAGDGTAIGGDTFGNHEGLLPTASGRQYYECDIDTVGQSKRGAERIVFSNDGLIYYTGDHYESFELLYAPICQTEHLHEDACYENQHENHHH